MNITKHKIISGKFNFENYLFWNCKTNNNHAQNYLISNFARVCYMDRTQVQDWGSTCVQHMNSSKHKIIPGKFNFENHLLWNCKINYHYAKNYLISNFATVCYMDRTQVQDWGSICVQHMNTTKHKVIPGKFNFESYLHWYFKTNNHHAKYYLISNFARVHYMDRTQVKDWGSI